jgi:hypothetical protein
MFANTQMMGMDTGFPDVCLTPAPPAPAPIPIPYPNIGMGPTATSAVYQVLFMYAPAHNMSSKTAMSNGDNAGLATGVASGTVMAPVGHVTAAFTVLVGGQPATRLTSVAIGNQTNCPGVRAVPSQVKVLLLAP